MAAASDLFFTFGALGLLAGLFFFWRGRELAADAAKREGEMSRRMYELAILKEIGERIGYSLNIQNIAEVIAGSLDRFLGYRTVSYMLLKPGKIVFRVRVEEPVSRSFIDEVKERMLGSLSALLDRKLEASAVEEVISGDSIAEEPEEPVRSFFNIPLSIGDTVAGVLTVAHVKEGLYAEEEMSILYQIVGQASRAVARLEEVVASEERKLSSMVESMAEGVVMLDKDYRIVVANPAAKGIVGIPKDERATVFDFIEKLGHAFAMRGKIEESMALDSLIVDEDVFINGRFYQIFVSPVKSVGNAAEEEVLGSVVIFHDVTHEKETERLREDFIYMLIHDLRSPLDNIRKTIDLIFRSGKEKTVKTYEEYLTIAYDNISEMLSWVNDLLDITKIEAGKFEVLAEDKDVRTLVEDEIKSRRSALEEAELSVETRFAGELPLAVSLDPRRVRQVIGNFIENSMRFTDVGGTLYVGGFLHKKGANIDEEARREGFSWRRGGGERETAFLPDSLVVAVTDTGIGIPKDEVPLLFDRFASMRRRREKKGGPSTGLGLIISKGIIEAHGGVLGVRSEEGEGSTFFFTLPVAAGTDNETAKAGIKR